MRKTNLITALVAGGLALVTTNLRAQGTDEAIPITPAQQVPEELPSPVPAQTRYPAERLKEKPELRTELATTLPSLRASTIIGLTVRNDSGERLGRVQDLIVSLDARSVPFAIVEYGGTLGIGATRVAVPLSDLKFTPEPKQMTLSTTKDQFQTASPSPTGAWLAVAGEDWMNNVDRFYGQPAISPPFERQEVTGMNQGREPVRTPAETDLQQQNKPVANPANPGLTFRPTDQDLMNQINGLVHQQVGDNNGVQVTIKEGTVTLKGQVADEAQKQTLEKQIKVMPGVDRVQDNLRVSP